MQHFEYQNYFVFYWPTSTVLLIIFCFSGSSINAKKKKKKFWGVTHLLHMCVIFPFLTNDSLFLLFQLKSYFHPRDIQIFVIFSFPFLTFQIQKTSEYDWNCFIFHHETWSGNKSLIKEFFWTCSLACRGTGH